MLWLMVVHFQNKNKNKTNMSGPHISMRLNDQMQERYPCASTEGSLSLCCMEWLSRLVNCEFTCFKLSGFCVHTSRYPLCPLSFSCWIPRSMAAWDRLTQIKEGEICEPVFHKIIRKAKELNERLSIEWSIFIECPLSWVISTKAWTFNKLFNQIIFCSFNYMIQCPSLW